MFCVGLCEVKYEAVPFELEISGTGATTLPPPKSYSSRGDSSPMSKMLRMRRISAHSYDYS